MDANQRVAEWEVIVEAFNRGDLEPLAALLADDCVFESSVGTVGSSKDEIIRSIREGREAGWTSHHPLSPSAAGDFLIGLYENRYADGSSVVAAGILRYGSDGKVTEIRSLEPLDYVARMSAG